MEMVGESMDAIFASQFNDYFCVTITPIFELLTAYYFFRTLEFVFAQVDENEFHWSGPTKINWTGNLGIPVDHYDSSVRTIYESMVSRVALGVLAGEKAPSNLIDFDDWYQSRETRAEDCPFFLVSELEATVIGLTRSKTTKDGIYPVFDVGGGTVDGAVVEFRRENGTPLVNFLTSLVEPIGAEARGGGIHNDVQIAKQLRSQVARVVHDAHLKAKSSWPQVPLLQVFVTGGGRNIEFYRNQILSTYS